MQRAASIRFPVQPRLVLADKAAPFLFRLHDSQTFEQMVAAVIEVIAVTSAMKTPEGEK